MLCTVSDGNRSMVKEQFEDSTVVIKIWYIHVYAQNTSPTVKRRLRATEWKGLEMQTSPLK